VARGKKRFTKFCFGLNENKIVWYGHDRGMAKQMAEMNAGMDVTGKVGDELDGGRAVVERCEWGTVGG
jgi:hypothetical protein